VPVERQVLFKLFTIASSQLFKGGSHFPIQQLNQIK
jgi:hypothetical protein